MSKAKIITISVIAIAITLSLAFYFLAHKDKVSMLDQDAAEQVKKSKPSLAASISAIPSNLSNPEEESSDARIDLRSMTAVEIQDLTKNKFGDTKKISPRFEDYSREDQTLFLDIFTLGYGKDFLNNLENYTTPIGKAQYISDPNIFWADFIGSWHGEFISDAIKEQDTQAFYELIVNDSGFKLSLHDSNTIYLATGSSSFGSDVATALTKDIPKSIILTLKAKPELGYKHNLYVHVFPSESKDYLLGSLYNTDQWLDTENYVLADKLIFQRVQPN